MASELEQLNEADREVVAELMDCVFGSRSEDHDNQVTCHQSGGRVHIRLAQRVGSGSYEKRWEAESTLVARLLDSGLLARTPKLNLTSSTLKSPFGPPPTTYYLTIKAKREFESTGTVGEEEIRRRVGRFLYAQYKSDPNEFRMFDAEKVGAVVGVDPSLVREQTRILIDVGMISETVTPINNTIGLGNLVLSKPQGILWASRAFPDELGASTSVTVHVSVI